MAGRSECASVERIDIAPVEHVGLVGQEVHRVVVGRWCCRCCCGGCAIGGG